MGRLVRACVRTWVSAWVGGYVGTCVGGWVGGWLCSCVCMCVRVYVCACDAKFRQPSKKSRKRVGSHFGKEIHLS